MNDSIIKPKILIVDDEAQIRKFLRVSLKANGFAVEEAEDGAEAVRLVAAIKPDMVILDLGLPKLDGQDVIVKVREWTSVPILVLSVRDGEDEKVKALDRGADDYMVKPFGVDELIARVGSILRRVAQEENAGDTTIESGPLHIDLPSRTVTIDGEKIKLSPKEFNLLKYLAINAGKVITHRQLLKEVWGAGYADDSQYLRVYMGQLRKKIEQDPNTPAYLLTEQGIGYKFAIVKKD
ncbi:MAG: response regulator transcription factor [Pseudomonadota bacterium]|nr:response regulator transcription factor [Pseudomonadota bacterium]